jgi:hypothetical protein
MGAAPIGIPGWPLLAFWTASIARKRMVLMQRLASAAGADKGSLAMIISPLRQRRLIKGLSYQFYHPEIDMQIMRDELRDKTWHFRKLHQFC